MPALLFLLFFIAIFIFLFKKFSLFFFTISRAIRTYLGKIFSLSYSLWLFMWSFWVFYSNSFYMNNVSKIFGFLSNYFGGFTYCVLFFLINNWKCSWALQGSGIFSVTLVVNKCRSFFSDVSFNNNSLNTKVVEY